MKRLVTSLVLIPVVCYVVIGAPQWLFLTVLTLVALVCYWEYTGIAAAYGMSLPPVAGYAAGCAILLLPSDGIFFLTLITLGSLALTLRWAKGRQVWPSAALFILGLVYIFGTWRSAITLRAASPLWLLYALALSWVGDIAAYYLGGRFGRRRLAPTISPGKTWVGAGASLAASVAFGLAFLKTLIPSVTSVHIVALSLVANAAGQCGDLAESALKRGAGVKDSGSMLPGHGGMLDRVDSTLFVLPVVSSYLQLLPST